MVHTIVLYHHHVNGDSLFARLLLERLAPLTEQYRCYVCAPRTHGSIFSDLAGGRFIFCNEWASKCPPTEQFHTSNGVLYVDMWIGWAFAVCVFCLDHVVAYYNTLLLDLSKHVSMSFEPITDSFPYVEFDYDHYNCGWIPRALDCDGHDAVVAVYNMKPLTFPAARVPTSVIRTSAEAQPRVLHITFVPTDVPMPSNVIDFKRFATMAGVALSDNYAVEFSRMCIDPRVSRVLACASGVCQFSFSRSMTDGKLLMIQDVGNSEAPFCHCSSTLCTKRFGFDCAVLDCKCPRVVPRMLRHLRVPGHDTAPLA